MESRRSRRRNCQFGIPTQTIRTAASCSGIASKRYLGGICSCLILSSLIGIVYLLLDYNCTTCKAKCDLQCITKHVENISSHLLSMKNSYRALESQVMKFSHEIPKFEEQLEVLETLANIEDTVNSGWNPKLHKPLPYVAVSLEISKKSLGNKPLNSSTQKKS